MTEIEKAEEYLRAVDGRFPELGRLRTIPGIGPILAPVIWSEIGRLERFRSARALVNYTGLVPSLYESGDVSIQGHYASGLDVAALGAGGGGQRSAAGGE